jgi:small neutral amino acid transporter SnatA (MarC family)
MNIIEDRKNGKTMSYGDTPDLLSIMIAIVINVIVVYFVLRFLDKIEKLLGVGGIAIIKKVFGIILLALAIKLFRKYTGL